MNTLVYYFFKVYVKTGLLFYTQKIRVSGGKNIPKEGAIVFAANHPNGLIDPLFIATHTQRKTHFLVRANVFNNKNIAYFFKLLGMMPIYRIRDGIKQLSKNEEIFNQCQNLLKNNNALLIFPEGSHSEARTIRPLSKGFTRIVFGTLNTYKNTQVYIVPVGITYQNISAYPSKVAINFGKPILANKYYDATDLHTSTKNLKNLVANQLKTLSVHINNDATYQDTLHKLNDAQTDFTQVEITNQKIENNNISPQKERPLNYAYPLFLLVIINTIIPYSIWKLISKKIDEIEFIDTFRFGINLFLIPLCYLLQSFIVAAYFDWLTAVVYLLASLLLILTYTKLATTPPPLK